MKACAGFCMRAPSTAGSRHHAPQNARPGGRRLSAAAAKSSRLHAPHSPAWKSSEMLQDSVVWAEATESCKSVTLLEQIGEGRCAAVYCGVDAESGESVAVKQIQTRGNGVPGSKVAPFKVALEADIHQAVSDCPCVATLKAHLRLKDKDCLVTELCGGGDLEQHSRRSGPLQEAQVAEIAREATSMLRTCHKRGILHGDIKAANFVVRSKKDASKLTNNPSRLQRGWLKAVDFGCSMRMGKGKCSHRVGTPTNWPPEVFNAQFGLAADMWGLGTMLCKLATGRMPYFTADEGEAFRTEYDIILKIVSREVDFESPPWDAFSDDAKDFIRRLLLREEGKRMTAEEAARHPFLNRSVDADGAKPRKETCRRRQRREQTQAKRNRRC